MGKECMNTGCKKGKSEDWKKGWPLKSALGFSTLCYTCGSVYENSLYCETFHVEESGWRECRICGKRMHCGCIVSKDLHDYLDFGGVGCVGCVKRLENQPLIPLKVNGDMPNGFGPRSTINIIDPQSSMVENFKEGIEFDKGKLIQLDKAITKNDDLMHQSKAMVENNTPTVQIKQEGKTPSLLAKQANYPAANFSMASPFGMPNNIEAKKPVTVGRCLPFQLGEMASQRLLKADANKETVSETRVARPPAEGRGRSQLLPRYWPRITDQELQQISGEYPLL